MQLQLRKLCPLITLLALLACSGTASPTPDDVATQVAVQTVSATTLAANEATLTPTPMSTATPAITAMETRMSLPTPDPTATPAPSSTAMLAPTAPALVRVGQIGGVSAAVAVQSHYAYINVGPRLVILDITEQARPVLVGQSSLLPGFENLVVSGNYAIVAAGEGGLRVVDVSDPTAPAEVGGFATPGPAWGVATVGSTAYVAAWDGLHILDISNPQRPAAIGFYSTPDAILDLTVIGDIAYLAEAFSPIDSPVEKGGLRLVDVADPAHLEEISFYPMNPLHVDSFEAPDAPRGAQSVAVAGGRAYIAYRTERQGGLRILDVLDPAQPREIGDYRDYVYYVSDVAVVEDPSPAAGQIYAYLATGVNMGLLVLDVSDPARPEVLADDVPGWARDLAVVGDTLLIADEAGGLQIADISDPAHPTGTGSYTTLGDARGIVVSDDRAYVTDGLRDLWIVDVSDPARPAQADVLTSPGSIFDVSEAASLAYVAAETEGLLVLDVSDAAHLTQISAYDTPGLAYGVDVAGAHVYVADGQLQVLDITEPTAPTFVGSYEGSARIENVVTMGDAAYLTDGGLEILDISDPANPMSVGGYAAAGAIADTAVKGDHAYLVVKGDLLVVDISNPADTFELGRLELTGMPEYGGYVAVGSDAAYVGGGQRLYAVDVSEPANPREIASYEELHSINGLAAAETGLFVADGPNGLVVLQLRNQLHGDDAHPAAQSTRLPTGEIRDLWVALDGRLWVGTEAGVFARTGEGWLQVFEEPAERLLGADTAGRIWALLDGGASIASYDETGTWSTYGLEQGWTALPPHQYLSPGYGDGLVTDERGRVWWATGQDDLRRFEPASQTWSVFRAGDLGFEPPEDEDYQGHFITDVQVVGSQVWVGDCIGMGEVYSGEGVRWTDGEAWFDVPFTAGQCVMDIEADDAGRIWVGGFDSLFQYDPATGSWSRFPLPNWERRQLVVEIQLDSEGNPWLEILRYGGASPFGAVGHYHLQDRQWIMDFEGRFSSLAFGVNGLTWACSEGAVIQLQGGLAEELDRLPGSECQVVADGAGSTWITDYSELWTLEPGSESEEAPLRVIPRRDQGTP